MSLLDAMNARLDRLDEAAKKKLAKTMTEARLRDHHIVPLAKILGYLVYWTWNSKHSPAGFPDVFLLHPVTGTVIIRELKMVGGGKKHQPTEAQQAWLDAFGVAGLDAAVWTPADMISGRIREELLRGTRRTA
ncbi:VRR-NUC domain-containing protein [Nonomuraea basaltis]|uniref:VRR-NUC domain-containing protein n=1 Tax=Nonomuraea basaltis TaxID=2495887 RepID=UPI00110C54EE|nr:VRR-NUC domain-containing protein [Nonomuraea basaltis]TMR92401.1 VRR-NUC domain-containing protein [Nonomuraea basaltis]